MRAASVSATSILALMLGATSMMEVHSWSCDEGYDSETYDTLSIQVGQSVSQSISQSVSQSVSQLIELVRQ